MEQAIQRMFEAEGSGYCFSSDQIWSYWDGTPPDSSKRPAVIKQAERSFLIAPTGAITKAVSGSRKGSPTREFTFGSAIDPQSLPTVERRRAISAPADTLFEAATEETNNVDSAFEIEPPNPKGRRDLNLPLQRIIHGCPGSGKSFTLKNDAADAHHVIRCVFHPESNYTDFVGGLRPQSIYRVVTPVPEFLGATSKLPGEPVVQYILQPGAFLKAYQLACLHPERSVVLIIEEISRAPAAQIFGDILQLLDRIEEEGAPDYGYSAYDIDARPDVKAWLLLHEVWHDKVEAGHMRLPPNLYIWATMNKADQNARQLDAAFLRRWDKYYLSYLMKAPSDAWPVRYGAANTTWGILRSAINQRLLQIGGISEDRFIGPWMLPRRKLLDHNAIYEDLWGYLWHDVLRSRAQEFFLGTTTFAELKQSWNNGEGAPFGQIEAPRAPEI